MHRKLCVSGSYARVLNSASLGALDTRGIRVITERGPPLDPITSFLCIKSYVTYGASDDKPKKI